MKYVIALALIAFAMPALAVQVPQPAPLPNGVSCEVKPSTPKLPDGCDPHIRIATYHERESVWLVGAIGRSMTIRFSPDERIDLINFETPPNVGGKQIDSPWQTIADDTLKEHPLVNILPLWAVKEGRSSLQVVTATNCPPGGTVPDCRGARRTYYFQLTALAKQPDNCTEVDCDNVNLMTGIEFINYPEDTRRNAQQKAQIDREARLEKIAADKLEQEIFYGPRNWRYTIKGKPEAKYALAPDEISDNGQSTVFVYSGRRELPVLKVIDPYGKAPPRAVTPDPKNNGMFVLWESDRLFELIKGDAVVQIARLDPVGPLGMYPKRGENPHTGTTSPSVVRTLRSASN